MNQTKFRWVAGLVLLAVAAAGVSFYAVTRGLVSLPGAEDDFLSASAYAEEFDREVRDLAWPTDDRPSPPQARDDTGYQRGVGRTDAQMKWLCAWELAYLTVRASDPAEAAQAIATARGVRRLEVWDAYDDASRRAVQTRLDRAASGDPTGIQVDVNANCMAGRT